MSSNFCINLIMGRARGSRGHRVWLGVQRLSCVQCRANGKLLEQASQGPANISKQSYQQPGEGIEDWFNIGLGLAVEKVKVGSGGHREPVWTSSNRANLGLC